MCESLLLAAPSWMLLLFARRIALYLRQFNQQILQALLLLLFLALVRLWTPVVINLTAAGGGHGFARGHGLVSGSRVLAGGAGAEDTLWSLCHRFSVRGLPHA